MRADSIQIDYVIHCPIENQSIQQIGGTHPNGTPWKISLSRAIRAIEGNEWKFHLKVNEVFRKIIVVKSRGGLKSLGVLMNPSPEVVVPLAQIAVVPQHIG